MEFGSISPVSPVPSVASVPSVPSVLVPAFGFGKGVSGTSGKEFGSKSSLPPLSPVRPPGPEPGVTLSPGVSLSSNRPVISVPFSSPPVALLS